MVGHWNTISGLSVTGSEWQIRGNFLTIAQAVQVTTTTCCVVQTQDSEAQEVVVPKMAGTKSGASILLMVLASMPRCGAEIFKVE